MPRSRTRHAVRAALRQLVVVLRAQGVLATISLTVRRAASIIGRSTHAPSEEIGKESTNEVLRILYPG